MDAAIVSVEQRGRIAVWTLNNPGKLNCLNNAMLDGLFALFAAAPDAGTDAVVLTGSGRYFSAGAALGELSPGVSFPCRPSTFLAAVADMNCHIFDGFIHYPKPIFIAANGPCVGAATTLQLLCDANLCVPSATFWTPFKKLGITPEGCSTLTFAKKMGAEGARRMLEDGEKIDARTAKALGFVDVLVEDESLLLDTAVRFAEDWVRQGKGRVSHQEAGMVEKLDALNQREGKELAAAILSRRFMEKMGVPWPVAMVASPVVRLFARL
jgi:Delta3-Delta2-enoyl-CoA isomerase